MAVSLVDMQPCRMIQFDAAPPVPVSYHRLRALSSAELAKAYEWGYVADHVDPTAPVRRPGRDITWDEPPGDDDLQDWRIRTYVIWFCYIYENFQIIDRPAGSIEELILEFRAPGILDPPGKDLGTYYAGAGAHDPLPTEERTRRLEWLRPYYEKAMALLDG